ncbi:MAG: hypothetical protein SFU27_07800 [Thermonemataceae bacterium]|nr:hypothetical protein [Thermonemataceae bacterium]
MKAENFAAQGEGLGKKLERITISPKKSRNERRLERFQRRFERLQKKVARIIEKKPLLSKRAKIALLMIIIGLILVFMPNFGLWVLGLLLTIAGLITLLLDVL